MARIAILGGLSVLMIVHLALGSPIVPFAEEQGFRRLELEPFSRASFSVRCAQRERTAAMVYGHGLAPLALYVYDSHGNCVARDDFSPTTMTDDLAVAWYPATTEIYDVQLHNLGHKQNVAELAIR